MIIIIINIAILLILLASYKNHKWKVIYLIYHNVFFAKIIMFIL